MINEACSVPSRISTTYIELEKPIVVRAPGLLSVCLYVCLILLGCWGLKFCSLRRMFGVSVCVYVLSLIHI